MLKMYYKGSDAGSSPEFWEKNWCDSDFDQALQFCAVDPLRPLFDRYLYPGALMLEGGCGMGQYVAYYSSQGVKVVGFDFARETLVRLQRRKAGLTLCAGDVGKLPFRNEAFDVYYSGGVVEHLEHGPETAIQEAWRILKPGGILLISVPYLNPIRAVLSLTGKDEYRQVYLHESESRSQSSQRQFFQYVYKPNEFQPLLEKAGFQVIDRRGYSVLWGLYEVPLIGDWLQKTQARRQQPKEAVKKDPAVLVSGMTAFHNASASQSVLRRLIVREDDSVPVIGLAVQAARWFAANMMMYVGHRSQSKM
ncbi:MAG: class I SAM-dependent methyltransferase [Blastocatellia bacterium]